MLKKLLALGVALVCVGPSTALVGVGVLMNPAATATCVTSSLVVGPIPDSLTATTKDGTTITLNKTQLTHAA
ncbi:MAG: M23 family peptidase, partial [Actinobacteria bacterium]|nr:M23 family peptidase [Actinomycetota bacterium]